MLTEYSGMCICAIIIRWPILLIWQWLTEDRLLTSGGSILGVKFLDPLAGLVVSGMILKAGLETGYQRYSVHLLNCCTFSYVYPSFFLLMSYALLLNFHCDIHRILLKYKFYLKDFCLTISFLNFPNQCIGAGGCCNPIRTSGSNKRNNSSSWGSQGKTPSHLLACHFSISIALVHDDLVSLQINLNLLGFSWILIEALS